MSTLQRNQRAGEQIVARPRDARVRRRGIAGAEDVELRFRIVGSGHPRVAAAVARRFEIRPRLEPRIAGVHRHRIELPLKLAGFRIEGLQESRAIEIVAGAHDHVIADDDGRRRREILLIEIGDLDVPALFAGFRVERHEVIVGRLEEQIVAPDAGAAIADMRGAARLPEVVPDLPAVERVERPHVVGRGDIQDAVHLQDGAFDGAAGELARADAADDRRRQTASRSRRHARHPRERQILHVRRD